MSDNKTLYISEDEKWKIIPYCGMWGVTGYSVENFKGFWASVHDGGKSIDSCLDYLKRIGITVNKV